jgi:NAD(P)-dependent dehydrogenase (short-subunit alcohol dehydrogenase family)
MQAFSYEGSRVVVTGGSRGVGAALLDMLAELDVAHVTVLDVAPPSGPHDVFIRTDLADEQAVRAAIAAIEDPVHVLFNNAGVADTQPSHAVLSVNFLALRTLSEELLARMPEGSAIVNTASTAGNLWRKHAEQIDELLALDISDGWKPSLQWFDDHASSLEQGPYNFSKEIVVRYTMRSSRPTMRRGVRTNAVCPGPVDTPLLRDFRATATDEAIDWNIREMAGRAVLPREVAGALAFLGSPVASYINGVNLDVDGGFFAALATGQVDYGGRARGAASTREPSAVRD